MRMQTCMILSSECGGMHPGCGGSGLSLNRIIMSDRARLPVASTHHVRDTCLCLHVQRAARAVARRFDEALRPLGLTSGQFSLMMSLNRPEAPSIGEVSA